MKENQLLKYMEEINSSNISNEFSNFKKYQLVSSVYELTKKLYGYSITKGLLNSSTEELEKELNSLLKNLELVDQENLV